jgi:hypothetical protein
MTRYHVGGVVLLAENDNFVPPDTVAQAHAIKHSALEWDASKILHKSETGRF